MAEFTEELVAPCSMNCGVCSAYLAYSRKIPRKRGKIVHCFGCRPRNKQCAFIKGSCKALGENKVEFCFECNDFPCYQLRRIDERYRKNYDASFVENLEDIRKNGIKKFLEKQRERYKCPKCGGVICIHNKKCYDCDKIESWKG
jgi:hypothetical protein